MNRVSIKKLPYTIVVSSRAASLETQRSRTWTSTLHRGQRDCCCCVSLHPLEVADGFAPPQISQVCASSILRATAACRSWLFFIQVILATTVLLTLALSLTPSLTHSFTPVCCRQCLPLRHVIHPLPRDTHCGVCFFVSSLHRRILTHNYVCRVHVHFGEGKKRDRLTAARLAGWLPFSREGRKHNTTSHCRQFAAPWWRCFGALCQRAASSGSSSSSLAAAAAVQALELHRPRASRASSLVPSAWRSTTNQSASPAARTRKVAISCPHSFVVVSLL